MASAEETPDSLANGREDALYSKYMNGVPDEKVIDQMFAMRATKHAEDAIDYEDIDELADDDLPEEEEPTNRLPEDEGELDDVLDEDDEMKLQNQANDEFEGFFGDDDENNLGDHDHTDIDLDGSKIANNNDIFNDLHQTKLADDEYTEISIGGVFEDEEVPGEHDQKRKLELVEKRQAKKRKLEEVVAKLEARLQKKRISYFYPNYLKNKPYNHYFLNIPEPLYFNYPRPSLAFKSNIKPLIPTKLKLEIDIDYKKAFKSKNINAKLGSNQNDKLPDSANKAKGIVYITNDDLNILSQLETENHVKSKSIPFLSLDGKNDDQFTEFGKDLILSTTDWNDDDIINAGDPKEAKVNPKRSTFKISDQILNSQYDYDDESIFSGQIAPEKFQLDMNDPNLLFSRVQNSKKQSKALVPTNPRLLEMKFNVSNDKQYEILKNNYHTKVRSQLSNLNIEHSIPALRLQTPYYKVKLTKAEARAFHRPKFIVRPGSLVSFTKLKIRKKKKDRGKSLQEIFSKTSDLTTTDTGSLIGMEYAEEYPNILSNFGMCSKLINYYRKEKEDDNSRPKAPIGETHVLGVEDRSPFWNFGYVAKGDFVPTLYNNMVRAPIFKHPTRNTDFLLIRSHGCGNHQRYYLRPMDHLFAVGCTFPAVEVPAPHSRKVTNTFKNRLKMVVYRTMNKNGVARVSVKDISQHFPDQNDMQNRQRLKEFMEYQRQGEDQGFWKIRNSSIVPTEEKVRAMITPEDASLLDSMQHGQQILEDAHAIYRDSSKEEEKKETKKEVKEENEDEKDSSPAKKDLEKPKKKDKEKGKDKDKDKDDKDGDDDVDEELSPWSSTRNFVNSNQTKAMLQLNGDGDPTGIGLGFSFLRSTQKSSFQPLFPPPKESVPKTNTASYQQKLYEAEISRIWYAQRRSLTVDHQEGHDLNSIYQEYKPVDHEKYLKAKLQKEKEDKTQKNGNEDKSDTMVLRITRRFRDKNNIVQRKTEIIKDPRLIKAYIKKKKQIEGEKMSMADVGDIIPTNDAEVNKIRKKALEDKIASLQKRAKLSKGRKSTTRDPLYAAAAAGGTIIDANTVLLPDGSYAIGGKGIGKGNSTTRRCASCGAFGHIRTNKSCPLYVQTRGGTVPIDKDLKEQILAEHARNNPPKHGKGSPPVKSE